MYLEALEDAFLLNPSMTFLKYVSQAYSFRIFMFISDSIIAFSFHSQNFIDFKEELHLMSYQNYSFMSKSSYDAFIERNCSCMCIYCWSIKKLFPSFKLLCTELP